ATPSILAPTSLLFVALASRRSLARAWGWGAGVQVVIIQHGIEEQEEAAVSFRAPHGVVGKKHHMPFPMRDINHGRLFGDLIAAGDHSAEQELLFRGKAQYHAGESVAGRQLPAGSIGYVLRYIEFLPGRRALGLLLRRDIQPPWDHMGIGEGSPTAGASGARPFTAGGSATSTSRTSLPAAEACAYRDNRPLAEVDVE